MVSIDRDYSRVMLFDTSGPSRKRITSQLTAPPLHPHLINPYLTSIDDGTSGPYSFHVETISASNARGLVNLPNYKLPGVIVLSLDKKTMGAFVNVCTNLLESKLHQRCPIVCVVGASDLKFHKKLQRTIALAEQNGLTSTIDWDCDNPQQDAESGLESLSARLKRIVHRTMCADFAMKEATNLERRDNKLKPSQQKISSSNVSSTQIEAKHLEEHHKLAMLMATPKTSPMKSKSANASFFTQKKTSLFNFDRAGKTRKIEAQRKIEKLEKGKRWHRKNSLNAEDLQKYLGGPKLSNRMKARLKSITKETKKKLVNKPVVAVFRDVLQPNFMKTKLPNQRVSKADNLTWKGYEMLYDVHLLDIKRAILNFTISIKECPEHFYAIFYRSLAYAIVGRYRLALVDMKHCLQLVEKNKVDDSCPGTDPKSRLIYICNFNLGKDEV